MHWILNETVARLHIIIGLLSQVASHSLTYLFFQVSGKSKSCASNMLFLPSFVLHKHDCSKILRVWSNKHYLTILFQGLDLFDDEGFKVNMLTYQGTGNAGIVPQIEPLPFSVILVIFHYYLLSFRSRWSSVVWDTESVVKWKINR